MKNVIVSMNVTVDGFMSGPNCELDWHFESWDREMSETLCEQLSKADTILLGRVTYQAMAKYWPLKAADLSFARQDIAFADMMNTYSKIVFSRTLTAVEWNNSKLMRGNVVKEISVFKAQPGKDIMIYGSGKLIEALIAAGLIDEYHLWVHPVVLGKGKPLFRSMQHRLRLELFDSRTFFSGVVLLRYRKLPG